MRVRSRAPFVDMVFGPQTLHRLPGFIDEIRARGRAVVDVSFPEIEKFDRLPEPRADGPTAFVSIMEGCSKYCSFCVVPYTRGEEVSRPLDDVVAEVAGLAAQGVREVTLLGQNVNGFRGPTHDGKFADLALLIDYVALIDGIERIRFTTSHPREFNDRLIDAYARVPKLANHLHLPVQSGSDRILTLMKRGHTVAEYREKIRALRAVRPDISISTDLIVGFPGETEADFAGHHAADRGHRFRSVFQFCLQSAAGHTGGGTGRSSAEEEKLRRLAALQAKITAHAQSISRDMIGTVQRVLVERPSRKNPHQLGGQDQQQSLGEF